MIASKLTDLKAELSRLLTLETTDFQSIIQITAEIAKQQPEVVRFTTDAAMIRRLGRELVAKQETALAELVKNAYDADSTHCTVTIVTEDSFRAMEINDDGHGMSRTDIEGGFMRLASDSKIKAPISPKFHRSRAGKKGIGRFATERLGNRLTIVTQTEDEDHAWKVTIDWTAFLDGNDINLIANSVVETRKERPHGTRLLIESLNDPWTDAELKRVYRYLSTLLDPSFGKAKHDSDRLQIDRGFTVELTRDSDESGTPGTVINAETEILEQALAVIQADIDSGGFATWALCSTRLNINEEDQPIGLDRNRVEPVTLGASSNAEGLLLH